MSKRTNALFNSGDELEPDFALIMLLRRLLKLFHGRKQLLNSICVRGLFADVWSLVQEPWRGVFKVKFDLRAPLISSSPILLLIIG